MPALRWIRVLLSCVALAGAAFLTGCGGDETDNGAGGDGNGSGAQVAEHSVGETFEVNQLTWTVLSCELLDEVESLFSDTAPHQPTRGKWLVVTMDFRGREGLSGGYDIAALKVRDHNAALYDVAEPGGAADDYRLTHEGVKNLSLAMLNNPQAQRVFAIYDVPDAGAPFTLEWMGADGGTLVTLCRVGLTA